MGPLLDEQPLSATTPWVFPENDVSAFGKQLREVAKLIKISKSEQFVEVFSQPAHFLAHSYTPCHPLPSLSPTP